jgi:hypothetical protein
VLGAVVPDELGAAAHASDFAFARGMVGSNHAIFDALAVLVKRCVFIASIPSKYEFATRISSALGRRQSLRKNRLVHQVLRFGKYAAGFAQCGYFHLADLGAERNGGTPTPTERFHSFFPHPDGIP